MNDAAAPRYWAVVPAAGSGSRMGHDIPKQYLPLHGKPILQHTLERLGRQSRIATIVVALARDDGYWSRLDLRAPIPVVTVEGGEMRHHSVLNALHALSGEAAENDWVLVHDAARPCIRAADIEGLMTGLADDPCGGILAVPVKDTMKRVRQGAYIGETVDRHGLWHALTPQMFRYGALTSALENAVAQGVAVTDESQAMEAMGHRPRVVAGHADNIKVTVANDLPYAELILELQAREAEA